MRWWRSACLPTYPAGRWPNSLTCVSKVSVYVRTVLNSIHAHSSAMNIYFYLISMLIIKVLRPVSLLPVVANILTNTRCMPSCNFFIPAAQSLLTKMFGSQGNLWSVACSGFFVGGGGYMGGGAPDLSRVKTCCQYRTSQATSLLRLKIKNLGILVCLKTFFCLPGAEGVGW